MKNICFAASSGGHLEELLRLKPLIDKYESFLLTEKTEYENQHRIEKIYFVKQINRREKFFLFKIMENFITSFKIYIKEKPSIIITTGALAMLPMCFIIKIAGGRIIFIESFAKVNTSSMTGRVLSKFADKIYVQWSEMEQVYSNAEYIGSIF